MWLQGHPVHSFITLSISAIEVVLSSDVRLTTIEDRRGIGETAKRSLQAGESERHQRLPEGCAL